MCLLASLLPLLILKIFQFKIDKLFYLHIGLSYVSFRSLQVIIEINDRLIKQLNFFQYVNFLLFFPTLSSGPIDTSRRFENDIEKQTDPKEYKIMLNQGINRIFTGLLYKFIVAFLIKYYWLDLITHGDKGILNTICFMYAYSSYLFFDFAGYSFFATGFSYVFAIKTPDNFDKPFLSKNIKEFWNRWHMSLSYWFRDFVFMRVVQKLMKSEQLKSRLLIFACGYSVSFILMGLWHGFALHYLLYGIFRAMLLFSYEWFLVKKIKLITFKNQRINN